MGLKRQEECGGLKFWDCRLERRERPASSLEAVLWDGAGIERTSWAPGSVDLRKT
jgi:hypothetical protein